MRATLLGGTEIGEECLIAAGAVVPPGMIVPPRSVVMGVPGKIVRPARPDEIEQTRILCARYRALADDYLSGRYQSLDPARE
jgi:carbonic anhydrase/acetyltransferase-like protein (isoleucine patch superfamily)